MSPPKNPEATRARIVGVAAGEILQSGYKAASLGRIIESSGVSKGALYHHFPSKLDLAYAVFEEVYASEFQQFWAFPLDEADPIDAFCAFLISIPSRITEEEFEQGCPVCNIAMEMSGEDEQFKHRVGAMFSFLEKRLEKMIVLAKSNGQVAEHTDAISVAAFVVASIQGMQMQGMYLGDKSKVIAAMTGVVEYLNMLKVSNKA